MNTINDSFQAKLVLLKDLYRPSIDKQALLRACFIKDEQEILDSMTHLQLVTYTYKCSSSVVKLIKDKKVLQKTNECLDLVNQWIGSHYNNNKKPSNDALTKAAHAADAARSAANAASAAANAADAAAYAADAAAYAADAAHDAAHAAAARSAARSAAHYASNYNKAKHKQEQLNFKFLIETLKQEKTRNTNPKRTKSHQMIGKLVRLSDEVIKLHRDDRECGFDIEIFDDAIGLVVNKEMVSFEGKLKKFFYINWCSQKAKKIIRDQLEEWQIEVIQ